MEIQQVSPSDVGGDTQNTEKQDRPTREATVTARKRLKERANIIHAASQDVEN